MCSRDDDPTQHDIPRERPCYLCERPTTRADDDGRAICATCREDGGPNAGRDYFGRDDLPYSTWAE